MSIKTIKLLGSVLAFVGLGINLASNAIGERLLDDKIDTKIAEALKK